MKKPKQRYQGLNISGFRVRQLHRQTDSQTDTQTYRQTEKD